ncbi:protein LEG1 homolog [Asterias rubens]|uniref:protein LEG1 homolog n=1 Tax=Asterias rubens TaxID=7604 RepID=UPI0014559218|nr:protein LEG1 homolog [Asterias rubens]
MSQSHTEATNNIPHWDEAPASLADYPLRQNHTIIDPWRYLDRLGLYKILLNVTSSDATLGRANNTANILWGLPMQLGWQFSTGRLQDFTNETACGKNQTEVVRDNEWNCISPWSWWGSMNYFLSVVPFLGALEAGLFPHWPHGFTFLASLSQPEDYCTSVLECRQRYPVTMTNWEDFFLNLYDPNITEPHYLIRDCDDKTSTLSPREQIIITKMWVAHTRSVETGLALFDGTRLMFMSKPEQSFGLGWAHLIGYIAAANFVTDLNTTAILQMRYLPKRLLHSGDTPPLIPDLTWDENMVIYILRMAYNIDKKTGDSLIHEWQRLMCSPESRAKGRAMIPNLLNPFTTALDVIDLLWISFTVC